MPPEPTWQLFQELIHEVRRVNPASAESLRPGLSTEVAKQKLAGLPFQITPDAVALYTWADGADARFEMLPGAFFIPLSEALAEFEEIYGIREELEQIFPERYRDSFRFLSDWSDGGYAFGRMDSPSQGQVVHRCIHASWLLAFHDLADLLKTSIECYRQGVMRSGADLPDFRAYYKLAARMNPGLENWRG
jgi:hypothetical protein